MAEFQGNAEPICFASVDGVVLRRELQTTLTGRKEWRWVSDWIPRPRPNQWIRPGQGQGDV